MRPILFLALLLTTALAAADNVPDLAVARAAFATGAPHRAALFEGLGIRDDGRIRVSTGKAIVTEYLTIAATDIASGEAINESVDTKQNREPFTIALSDGRTAAVRCIRPSIGPAIIVITAIVSPPKATP